MGESIIWLIVAVVLGIAEIFTLTAALGMLGAAALITAGAAAIGLPLPAQLAVFAAASLAGVLVVRPVARRHRFLSEPQLFGVDSLIGKSASVLQEVTRQSGRIRLNGEEWSARPYDDAVVIPVGATVNVMRISGSTAIVYPRE